MFYSKSSRWKFLKVLCSHKWLINFFMTPTIEEIIKSDLIRILHFLKQSFLNVKQNVWKKKIVCDKKSKKLPHGTKIIQLSLSVMTKKNDHLYEWGFYSGLIAFYQSSVFTTSIYYSSLLKKGRSLLGLSSFSTYQS